MLDENALIINRIAQNIISIEKGTSWFETLIDTEKKDILLLTTFFIKQSHPTDEVIDAAIRTIPLKPTMTPVVILKKNSFKVALSKILTLPKTEDRKAFISLITIFKAGDSYRRNTSCKDACTHEWHNLI